MPGATKPSFIKTLGRNVLDLVFPVFCLGCGKEGVFLCDSCYRRLPRLEALTCVVCEKPSPFGKTHPDCVSRNRIDGLVSASPYAHPVVKKMVEVLKYKYVADLSQPMANLILEQVQNFSLSDHFKEFILVPVPLNKWRMRERGFNQSELIAKVLSERLEIPLNNELVIRKRSTKPQADLNKEKRKTNIHGAFEVIGSVPEKILLLDDVATTGSTLNEIARVLKQKNAREIWALTFARD
ncbi:MAG: ComF family protein [Acidobacteriaceae bacterium]